MEASRDWEGGHLHGNDDLNPGFQAYDGCAIRPGAKHGERNDMAAQTSRSRAIGVLFGGLADGLRG